MLARQNLARFFSVFFMWFFGVKFYGAVFLSQNLQNTKHLEKHLQKYLKKLVVFWNLYKRESFNILK